MHRDNVTTRFTKFDPENDQISFICLQAEEIDHIVAMNLALHGFLLQGKLRGIIISKISEMFKNLSRRRTSAH